MGSHTRTYTEAPTAAEIKIGYAPSEVSRGPFAKFLFWVFAGLAVTYAVTWGVVKALDEIQRQENVRYESMAARMPEEFVGPPLQPSPGHETLDHEDTRVMFAATRLELASKGLWWSNPENLKAPGKPGIGETALNKAVAALKAPAPATKPAADVR